MDVRTVLRSRRNPQFNREALPEALSAVGIGYVHLAGLGGFRHPRLDSPNNCWRNASFRGVADYMQTPVFEVHLPRLMELATHGSVAFMCAEAMPWRCHRCLIADTLTAPGCAVERIVNASRRQPHALTP